MPDARKSLNVLREEWLNCERCALGKRRKVEGGNLVFGEGTRRHVMLIGDGPEETEEYEGRPFVGKPGAFLRTTLKALGIGEYYLTNIVSCRSCSPQLDGKGQPIIYTRRGQPPQLKWKDEPPLPTQYDACRPRLEEEIYLVDPIIIVGLGSIACKALLQRHIAITKERGDSGTMSIPGASWNAVMTEKKKEWFRIKQGRIADAPIEQNMVDYLFVPTLHPSFVFRKLSDKSTHSQVAQLVEDLRKVAQVHETYLELVHGISPSGASSTDYRDIYSQYVTFEQEEL